VYFAVVTNKHKRTATLQQDFSSKKNMAKDNEMDRTGVYEFYSAQDISVAYHLLLCPISPKAFIDY
jgi:hypothetical protein